MDAIDGDWVRQALPGFFSPLEVVASVPTTMARAAELAASGVPEGATVVTEEQTQGRGRLGRAWVAPPGSSLLLSVVLRPPLPRDGVWLTVAAAGVALAAAVDEVAPKAAPALGLLLGHHRRPLGSAGGGQLGRPGHGGGHAGHHLEGAEEPEQSPPGPAGVDRFHDRRSLPPTMPWTSARLGRMARWRHSSRRR